MICPKCGRKLAGRPSRCRGCGTYTPAARLPAGRAFVRLMNENVRGTGMTVRRLCVYLLCLTAAVAFAAIAAPVVSERLSLPEIELTSLFSSCAPEPQKPEIKKTGRFMYVDLEDAVIDCDEQYEDSTYKLHAFIDEAIDIYVYREKPAGLEAHIARLYPFLDGEPEIYEDGSMIGGNYVKKATISAALTDNGKAMDIVFVNDGEYDHFLVIEISTENYEEYEDEVEKLLGSVGMYDMIYSSDSDAM